MKTNKEWGDISVPSNFITKAFGMSAPHPSSSIIKPHDLASSFVGRGEIEIEVCHIHDGVSRSSVIHPSVTGMHYISEKPRVIEIIGQLRDGRCYSPPIVIGSGGSCNYFPDDFIAILHEKGCIVWYLWQLSNAPVISLWEPKKVEIEGVKIVNGPSLIELGMSFYDRQPVKFEVQAGSYERKVEAVINSLVIKSTDALEFRAYSCGSSCSPLPSNRSFSMLGSFSTKKRSGTLSIMSVQEQNR